MHRYAKIACSLLLLPTLVACEPRQVMAGDNGDAPTTTSEAAPEQVEAPEPKAVERTRYAWLDTLPDAKLEPLESRFAPPESYARVAAERGSFAEFLRGLPVYAEKDDVRAYDGRIIAAPSAAVIALDIGDHNLQQCADTAIRLHAEYLWSAARRDEVAYHFTSGDRSAWSDWANGERFRVRGSSVERVRSGSRSKSRTAFRSYLDHVFMYAGTRSLRFDSKPADTIEPGTFFVAPGSPGHAVIVLDVAESDNGERIALLGQGFMPAQELHVLESNGSDTIDRVWWRLPEAGERLDTPSWKPFEREDARDFVQTGE
ncbi:MAG: DUF4846 domain-containing protein [Myxococcota bacterium]